MITIRNKESLKKSHKDTQKMKKKCKMQMPKTKGSKSSNPLSTLKHLK
jgi:hypothetical protein